MDIRHKIRQKMTELPKKLVLAARYALDNPDRIALDSMRATAKEIGVTSPTMVRLAQALDFDGYDEFKASFQSELVATGFGARAHQLLSDKDTDNGETLTQRILNGSKGNLETTFSQLAEDDLHRAVDLIRSARTCYLIGSGSLHWLASIFYTTGSMALGNLKVVPTEVASASEALGSLTADDVLICFGSAPCAIRTIDAKDYALSQGAKVIAFTDRASSPLGLDADLSFCAKTQSAHYYPSIISLLALVETVLATVVAMGDGSEKERIQRFETLRKRSEAYIEY